MSAAEDWATALRCSDILNRGYYRVEAADEPALLVQRVSRNPILCGGPAEYFSQDMPVWHPQAKDEQDLRPIDVLYGRYDPITREIEIFVNRIASDAGMYGAEPDELREIVRIHEHAHAVVHLGSRADDGYDHFATLGRDKRTEWPDFINRRTSWFSGFPVELHEFLAQALTYAAVQKLSVTWNSEKLTGVFDALELKQPHHYRLSASAKRCAVKADWALVLDAARGTTDVYRGEGFTLSAGLEALVCTVAEQCVAGDAPQAARP